MKRFAFCSFLFACCVFSSMAWSQEKKVSYRVGVGLVTPLTPDGFSDRFKASFTGELASHYFLSSQVALGGSFTMNQFGLDKVFVASDGAFSEDPIAFDGGDYKVYELAGLLSYHFTPENPIDWYILGGPGLALSSISDFRATNASGDSEVFTGQSKSAFMFAFGGGLTYRLRSKVSLFAELRFTHISNNIVTPNSTLYMPLRIGIVF